MAIKGAIFDMDGTLLDSMHVWIDIAPRYLKTKGITVSEEQRKLLGTMLLHDMSNYFIDHFGFTMTVDEIVAEIDSMVEDSYFYDVEVKPGIPELLQELRERGVKMCVATASDRYLVESALKRTGILNFFDRVFTCGEYNVDKKTPDIFEIALESLGTPKSETYVFEDTLTSVKTVKDAGFPLVAVRDKWSEKHRDQIKALADFYVDSPKDINTDLL